MNSKEKYRNLWQNEFFLNSKWAIFIENSDFPVILAMVFHEFHWGPSFNSYHSNHTKFIVNGYHSGEKSLKVL